MRQRLSSCVVLLVLALIAPIVGMASAAAQDEQRDRALAAATAQQILDLAAAQDFNALYDELHPDAQAVVPRAAAVGVFQEVYGNTQIGPAQVVGAQIVEWTWPVTGAVYDRAAAIAFIQPYVDEAGTEEWLEDTMYLVGAEGRWRWFFGSSREFVDEAIAQYGSGDAVSAGAAGAPITEGDLIANVVNDLELFYRDVISYTEFTYQSPGVVVVPRGEAAMSACGPAQGTFAGFYCPPDMTLYLDEAFMLQQDPFAAAFVIAHEWAHHIQSGVGFVRVGPNEEPSQWNGVYSIELEIMADCMSGVWAQDAMSRGLLAADDIDQAVQFALEVLGDPQYVGPYDPQAHGTGEQRAQAIRNGYDQGFLSCNVKL